MKYPIAFAACLSVIVGVPARDAWAQAPQTRVEVLIESPDPDAYLSGRTRLSARVEPDGVASSLVFFVDGRHVCTLDAQPFECDWDAGGTIKEHQVRAVANLLTGGRIVRTVRTKSLGFTEKVDVDVVQVTVTVFDEAGRFVRGLPRSAFHVAEDGQPQAVAHFASDDAPLELIVAIDISASMTAALPKLKTAVKQFLAAVPAGNQVTLLGFNSNIFALTRKTVNPADRVRAVDRLGSWGSTALYDAIVRGVDMLGRQTGRKVLVVFTDAEDQGSHASLADLQRRLQSSDVTLYMIGQGRGITVEPLRKVMTGLSTPTGGRALFTDNVDELHLAFTELLDELSNQYLLG
ncbi:MAG: VWA domain-containing protein, partial [Acidobacteria bacterium]|nr:VWA domain-containing protein [Acidobacteriota bacterium]